MTLQLFSLKMEDKHHLSNLAKGNMIGETGSWCNDWHKYYPSFVYLTPPHRYITKLFSSRFSTLISCATHLLMILK